MKDFRDLIKPQEENPKTYHQLWKELGEAIENGTMVWEARIVEDKKEIGLDE